jgi:hypothetical protein
VEKFFPLKAIALKYLSCNGWPAHKGAGKPSDHTSFKGIGAIPGPRGRRRADQEKTMAKEKNKSVTKKNGNGEKGMQDNKNASRATLPIPDIPPVTLTTFDAKDPDTKYPPITPLRPPDGAPNVLMVLIDDVGFGASSAFGGPCHTPNFEKLASNGLKYTRFHTTALCSPTRAALLSGRNHHTVGMGAITEFATSAPGNNSMRPNTCAPLAEILKLNG